MGSNTVQIFRKACHTYSCYTDRLAKKGLPCPSSSPLCEQPPETINHMLTSYVVIREVWFNVFQKIGLQDLTPQPDATTFFGWWNQAIKRVDKEHQKGLNLSINLEIWKHHKDCVFKNATPSVSLVRTLEEGALWCTDGA